MKPEIKAQWTAALRSGEYQQGIGRLRNNEGQFCCLGVLCDLAAKAGIGEWGDDPLFIFQTPNEDATAFLHTKVVEWAELDEQSPRILAEDLPLVAYNDGEQDDETGQWNIRPHTFVEIADLIDQHL